MVWRLVVMRFGTSCEMLSGDGDASYVTAFFAYLSRSAEILQTGNQHKAFLNAC